MNEIFVPVIFHTIIGFVIVTQVSHGSRVIKKPREFLQEMNQTKMITFFQIVKVCGYK